VPKRIQLKFSDFQKAVKKYLDNNFPKYNVVSKPGSGIRYEIFKKEEDTVPFLMWVVHRDEYVHKRDLTKTLNNLEIAFEDLTDLL
jgi:hypothetical protein